MTEQQEKNCAAALRLGVFATREEFERNLKITEGNRARKVEQMFPAPKQFRSE